MPACEASSAVVMGVSMPINSHDANFLSTSHVRLPCKDGNWLYAYRANMARKSSRSLPNRAPTPDWYLPEWMQTLGVKQAALAKICLAH